MSCIKCLQNVVIVFYKKLFLNPPDIEERLKKLEDEVQNLAQCCDQKPGASNSPLVIEQVYIEKVMVDKVEINNNLGALGISDLSGSLVIGANYGGSAVAEKDKEKEQVPQPSADKGKKQPAQGDAPNLNVKFG